VKESLIFSKLIAKDASGRTFDGWFDAGATLRQIQVEVHQSPGLAVGFIVGDTLGKEDG
jgi:hypothetical protein